jgi:hypothetical protein
MGIVLNLVQPYDMRCISFESKRKQLSTELQFMVKFLRAACYATNAHDFRGVIQMVRLKYDLCSCSIK